MTVDYKFAFDVRISREYGSSEYRFECKPPLDAKQKVVALATAVVIACEAHNLDPEIIWESMRKAIVDSCEEMRRIRSGDAQGREW